MAANSQPQLFGIYGKIESWIIICNDIVYAKYKKC
jgi:hypothetical protein